MSQSITPLWFYSMFCSWGTRPAEVPKEDRGRSGRKVADPNTTHNRKVVHFGGGSGRQPGRESGTVARGGPGRGRREVVEEAREDIRESTTTTNLSFASLSLSPLLRFFFATSSSVRCPFCVQRSEYFFLVSRGRIRKFYLDLWTFSPDPVTSSVVAIVER